MLDATFGQIIPLYKCLQKNNKQIVVKPLAKFAVKKKLSK